MTVGIARDDQYPGRAIVDGPTGIGPQRSFQKFNPPLQSNIDEADLSAVPELLQIGQAAAAQMDWNAILA